MASGRASIGTFKNSSSTVLSLFRFSLFYAVIFTGEEERMLLVHFQQAKGADPNPNCEASYTQQRPPDTLKGGTYRLLGVPDAASAPSGLQPAALPNGARREPCMSLALVLVF